MFFILNCNKCCVFLHTRTLADINQTYIISTQSPLEKMIVFSFVWSLLVNVISDCLIFYIHVQNLLFVICTPMFGFLYVLPSVFSRLLVSASFLYSVPHCRNMIYTPFFIFAITSLMFEMPHILQCILLRIRMLSKSFLWRQVATRLCTADMDPLLLTWPDGDLAVILI